MNICSRSICIMCKLDFQTPALATG
uniref:Uncharacterized protein n=1 Tax=Arundo donax TaxID=35708 RepID=A0A0A9H2U4_ARUDO